MICSFDKSNKNLQNQKYATIVAQQPIWDNAMLKHDDKTLCFKAGFIAAYYLFKNVFLILIARDNSKFFKNSSHF